MPTRSHRTPADLKRDLDLWHDEEASLQIETIAAACALIALAAQLAAWLGFEL